MTQKASDKKLTPSCNLTVDSDSKTTNEFSNITVIDSATKCDDKLIFNDDNIVLTNENIRCQSRTEYKQFSPFIKQTLACTGPLIATICSGLTTGYSAILLPQLQYINSTIPITDDEASWIASMAALPMAIGCLLGGVLMEKVGRKWSHIIVSILHIIGWIMLGFATSIIYLLIGRFITGIAVGILGPPCSVYIAETSAPKYRGFFLAAISLSISIGILIAHILGTFLSWQLTAFICVTAPCLCILFMLFVPESPNYLAAKGQLKEAEQSFLWLRGDCPESIDEMSILLNKYKHLNEEKHILSNDKNIVNDENSELIFKKLTKSYFIKPFLIINVFFAITQFSGVNAVAFYSVNIIQDTLGDNFNSYLAMALIDLTRLIMSVVACFLLRKYTRRFLAVLSTILTATVLIFLSLFIYNVDVKGKPGLEYIPLIALISYVCLISIGLVPLPWIMIGEVFPASVRSTGSGLCSCMCFIYFFIVVKTAPYLFFSCGSMQAYLTYGIIALIGSIILYFYLPETKDKTLEEIEAHFIK